MCIQNNSSFDAETENITVTPTRLDVMVCGVIQNLLAMSQLIRSDIVIGNCR